MSNSIVVAEGDDLSASGTEICGLAAAADRRERCPGASCPFWEGAPSGQAAGCAIERITRHLKTRPELSRHLLELRNGLGPALL
jgi:hypothetical protein